MESVPDLDTTTAILECKDMWDDFHATCRALKDGQFRVETHLKICTAAIAAVVMYECPEAKHCNGTDSRAAFVDGVCRGVQDREAGPCTADAEQAREEEAR